MIFDDVGTVIGPGETLGADICIVGSGAAGIAMALALDGAKSPSGQDLGIAVLESSRNNKRRQADEKHRYEDPDVQPIYLGQMNPSEATKLKQASAHEFFIDSRIRCYGGTTNCWEGWTQPLSLVDYDRREINAAYWWPFGRRKPAS